MKSIIKNKYFLLIILLGVFTGNLFAQEEVYKASKTQFMIRGYGHTGFNSTWSGDEKENTFVGTAFSPIFIFKQSDRFMFETELEFALENEALQVDFEYANMMYVLNDFMTIRVGKFLLPFGTFVERLHPAWINRLTNMPLGFGHDGIAPSSGIGVELRGAFQAGGSKFNYSLYTTNGPRIKDGSDEPDEAGMLIFKNFEDNNLNKALGGRIGWFPFSNSSLELGVSGYFADKVGDIDSDYENIGAQLWALDLSYVRQISAIGGILDIKAQYNQSEVDGATYYELEEPDTIPMAYTFNNSSNAYFAQISYRPTIASSEFIKNLELVGRYSSLTTPEGALWEQEATQWAFGLNYWINWRSLIKVSYQTVESTGGHDVEPGAEPVTTNGFFIHWAIGL